MWHPSWGNRLVFHVLLISNFLWFKKVFRHGIVPPLILRPGSGSHAVDPLSVRASPTLALFAATDGHLLIESPRFFFLYFLRSWPLIKSFFSLLFSWGTNHFSISSCLTFLFYFSVTWGLFFSPTNLRKKFGKQSASHSNPFSTGVRLVVNFLVEYIGKRFSLAWHVVLRGGLPFMKPRRQYPHEVLTRRRFFTWFSDFSCKSACVTRVMKPLSFQPVIQKTSLSLSAILIIPSPSKPVFQHFSLPGGTGLWYTHWPCAFSLDSLQSFHSSIRSKWREGGGFLWRILPVRLSRGRGISFFRSSCQSWPNWFCFLLSGGEVLLKEI